MLFLQFTQASCLNCTDAGSVCCNEVFYRLIFYAVGTAVLIFFWYYYKESKYNPSSAFIEMRNLTGNVYTMEELQQKIADNHASQPSIIDTVEQSTYDGRRSHTTVSTSYISYQFWEDNSNPVEIPKEI